MLAKDIYSQHFRAAQAVPRGVVAKLCAVVKQLDAACEKHASQVSVDYCYCCSVNAQNLESGVFSQFGNRKSSLWCYRLRTQ